MWAVVVWAMIRQGWSPPPPTDPVLDRMLDDMGMTRQATQVAVLGAGSSHPGRRTATGRDKGLSPNATLRLSPTEREVLASFAEGSSYEQIAEERGVSRETVNSYLAGAREKLGATNSPHAVAIAVRSRLI